MKNSLMCISCLKIVLIFRKYFLMTRLPNFLFCPFPFTNVHLFSSSLHLTPLIEKKDLWEHPRLESKLFFSLSTFDLPPLPFPPLNPLLLRGRGNYQHHTLLPTPLIWGIFSAFSSAHCSMKIYCGQVSTIMTMIASTRL